MSTRIEGDKPIQVTVPKGSTVVIIPESAKETSQAKQTQPNPTLMTSERLRTARFVPPLTIRKASQEILDRGENAEKGRSETELIMAMVEARLNEIPHGDFEKFLDQNLRIMGYQIGYDDPRLDEVREQILKIAEFIWTAVSEEELVKFLQDQTVPFPQKRQ